VSLARTFAPGGFSCFASTKLVDDGFEHCLKASTFAPRHLAEAALNRRPGTSWPASLTNGMSGAGDGAGRPAGLVFSPFGRGWGGPGVAKG